MSAGSKIEIRRPRLLLVEGTDEERFFEAALRRLQRADVQVIAFQGIRNLGGFLQNVVRDPQFPQVVGLTVVRDAETAPAGHPPPAAQRAFDSVGNALQRARLPVPSAHAAFASGPPRVGVFIIPDGASDGMLETLCLQAAAAEPGFVCVERYFACLAAEGVLPGQPEKARAHAWLASKQRPDRRVGEAAQGGDWPLDAPAFAPLWDFLRKV